MPAPKIIVFAAFQFDPEAAKDIDETDYPGVSLLKVEMNTDLQMKDLLKKQSSNESFHLIGQPDIQIKTVQDNQWQVEVLGFDYFDMETNKLESGGIQKIACWMLDTDYDGRSLYPRQVFFPMADAKSSWERLAKNLNAEIDEELISAYHGNQSLPFKTGENRRVAIKIVDDRGIESLKMLDLTER